MMVGGRGELGGRRVKEVVGVREREGVYRWEVVRQADGLPRD